MDCDKTHLETNKKPLTFDEYADFAKRNAVYPGFGQGSVYPLLGLCGETGEVAEAWKKMVRDKGGKIDLEFLATIKKELGDVLWYLWALGHELGFSLEDIANTNIRKLLDRKDRGTIHGSGNDR
jgi:NTP pyrophosphatase (non-canonical NTP hydrolase)